MTAAGLVEKVCPVVLRGKKDAPEILVFRHPFDGVQLVKGTREAGEAFIAGALRELAEEAGIVDEVSGALLCSSSAVAAGQLWHFVLVQTPVLPGRWAFDTADDGGHRFELFWWPLNAEPDREWHADSARALSIVRGAVTAAQPEAAATLSRYAERINTQVFADVAPLIAEDAVFWFGDGSHVGIAAVEAAFVATWQRMGNETYWLENLQWVAAGDAAACCIYRFCWQAIVDGKLHAGRGRGTSVLRAGSHGWQIVHEHLSPYPEGR